MGARLRKLLSHRGLIGGLFLVVVVSVLYLPNLGSYAFWDPWEPHYSQVAQEMADHGSWMDTWYRGQNRWWSKPILPLWSLRLSFALFDVAGPEDPWLHFAGRFPFMLFALLGVLLTYRWVGRLYDRRAGFYSALVLATAPMYALLAHQIMFDMPFVALCAPAVGHYFLARTPQGKPADLILFFVLTALAFLSKWLLALFIPAGILFAFLVLRWDMAFFRRVGLRTWLASLGLLVAAGLGFGLSLGDWAFAGMLNLVLLAFLAVFWMGKDAAAENHFDARWLWIGLGAMLVIVVPWHAFMVGKHGLAFVREAVIYHHFDRAAGTIGKPEGSFDIYVKQLAFALFPWVSLLPAAIIRLLKWGPADMEGQGRRDLWVFLAAAVPYTVFSLFQTKFHHYIFPVVPFLAVIVGLYLARMHKNEDRAWMRLSMALSLPLAAILTMDLLHDYKWFIQLFDYYYGWPLPASVNPYPVLGALGGAWILLLAGLFFCKRIASFVFAAMAVVAGLLVLYLGAGVLPAVTNTFTQEPLFRAYLKASPNRDPIAQYNGWLSRSASFYFENQVRDLSLADQPNIDRAIEFLRQPRRTFMILGAGHGRDGKALLADLRPKVRKALGKSLYVVYDGHPFSLLVSTERDPAGAQRVKDKILSELPPGIKRMNVDFGGKIELLGYKVEPEAVDAGSSFTISYFFRCKEALADDWLVFIHGDGPQGGSHRVFGDHAPLGGLHPTSEWQMGQIVQDDYIMEVPANYPYKGFTLWMGLWKGDRRLPVGKRHQHDGNDRVRSAYVKIN